MNNNGILLINKPSNITSNKITQIIKQLFKLIKIGYCGTLDPSASGLLVVCVGTKTKLSNNITSDKKKYIITAIIGIKSTTSDFDGKITFYENTKKQPTSIIIKKCLTEIKTTLTQYPPTFSSIKHNGVSLYKFARLDIKIQPKQRKIKLYKTTLIKKSNNIIIISVTCSHGVYLRSIIDDLSEKIKKPICTLKINRLAVKNYKITNSYNISDLKKITNISDILIG